MLKAGAVALIVASASAACPTVTPISNLNLTEWTRATWYVQQQQYNGYQKAKDLFCVAATYGLEGDTVPFFKGTVVSVHNYQNEEAVNSKQGGIDLCARVKDDHEPSKLLVSPCFLPNVASGPYWILAAEPSPEKYDFAIVSGGQPSVEYPDGCSTPESGITGSGLWYFSRYPIAPDDELEKAMDILKSMNISTSRLHPAVQAGCNYTGANIKPNVY